MKDLNFRLEGVLNTGSEQPEDFEGPLTLILQLLSKNKVEIKDIRISELTDQYIAHIEAMRGMDLDVASEFVRMAAHLVYIKTKSLLSGGQEEVGEMEQLLSSLEELRLRGEYLRIKEAARVLELGAEKMNGYFVKPPECLIKGPESEEYSLDAQELCAAMCELLGRRKKTETAPVVSVPGKIQYSAEKKAAEILQKLRNAGVMSLREVFLSSRSRSEVVATFVAVLELCNHGSVVLVGIGEDCSVSYAGAAQGDVGRNGWI